MAFLAQILEDSLPLGIKMRRAFVFIFQVITGETLANQQMLSEQLQSPDDHHVDSYFRQTGWAVPPSENRSGFPLMSLIEGTCFHLKDGVNIWHRGVCLESSVEILEETRSLGHSQQARVTSFTPRLLYSFSSDLEWDLAECFPLCCTGNGEGGAESELRLGCVAVNNWKSLFRQGLASMGAFA